MPAQRERAASGVWCLATQILNPNIVRKVTTIRSAESMPNRGRLLVGVNGREPDTHLIRYASMVAQLWTERTARAEDARRLRAVVTDSAANALLPNRQALGDAMTRPAADDCEVRFVHLLDRPTMGGRPLSRFVLRERVRSHFTGPIESTTVSCDVLKGRAIERLTTFAADFDGDLLLLGDGAWPRSKCARLVMRSPCSVWLVPPNWAPVLRRVLVPIDFSTRSMASLQSAIELARCFPPAKCIALHVDPPAPRLADAAAQKRRRLELDDAFYEFIQPLCTNGVEVEALFESGPHVGRAVARAADRHGTDLVVMSTRGRSGAAGWLLRSTTADAIREFRGSFLILKRNVPPLGMISALCERWNQAEPPQFS
jgi:nucleotide-binding universal stress UspA family protein